VDALMRRWANVGAGVLVAVAAAGLAVLSLLLFIGHCNEDIDLDDAARCEEDPTWLFPLPIGGPAIVLGIALLIAHRGRRSPSRRERSRSRVWPSHGLSRSNGSADVEH
jgi:hypothetical protein